jgi:hypothetical protein
VFGDREFPDFVLLPSYILHFAYAYMPLAAHAAMTFQTTNDELKSNSYQIKTSDQLNGRKENKNSQVARR